MKRVLVGFLLCSFVLVVLFIPLASELSLRGAQNTLSADVVKPQNMQSTSTNQVQPPSASINSVLTHGASTDQVQNAEGAVIAFCIEPGNLSVKEGDVFNVSVAVEDVPVNPGMESAEFHVSWDPTVLKGLSIVKVMFQDNSIGWDELNNTEGLLFYVHALCSDSIAGNQTLAIIAFEAIGQGSTSLHFTFVAACSPDSDKLNCESADGSVTVEKGNGASAPIASNKPENVLYTLTIIAGSASDRNTLILPPAIATEYVPFSVNIEIVNVTDMGAWEFGLCWNNSILNCTNAEIYNSNTWQTAISIDGEIDNNFNSTHGHYHIAVADAKEPYSGNITIATLTFNPVGAGTTPLTFDHVDVCDSDALKIKFSTTIGSITANEG